METSSKYVDKKEEGSKILANIRNRIQSLAKSINTPGVHSTCYMSAAGFEYTENGDTARCKDCGLEVSNWTLDMNPFTIHSKRQPDCLFVCSIIQSSLSNTPVSSSTSATDVQNTPKSNEQESPSKRQKIESMDLESLSKVLLEIDLLQQVRRRTFSHWPHRTIPSSAQMIEAGFFNCNVGDRVICIYCNLIIIIIDKINCSFLFLLYVFKRLFSSDTGTYKEARPFFISTKNLINDYFDGNLAPVFQTINSHTFVFVMYYAHFCGISRRMREPFEKAAAFYRERIPHGNITLDKFHVKFVAVDCFYHAGQCRKSYKLEYYPHMYLYVKGTRGYQYFGPTITSNLIEFIEKIRMPIIRLTNVDEFFDFIVQHESNVLAHFDFSNNLQRQYYSFFVQAALKHIEYDNEHPIRFAVILNQTVVEELSNLSNTTFPKSFVILNRLNSTPQIFPNLTNNFTIENLFQWIVNEPKQPYVGWIVPKNRYYSRSPSIDKATVFDALTNHDNLLIFHTSSKLDELKLRYVYFYLSICNTTHSSFWLRQIEKLYNQSLINLNKNISKTQHDLLSSCCQHILNQISSTDIYHLCLLNQQLPLFNFSETTTKACLPILNNIQLQKICYRDYCHQWLKTYASIYQQKLHSNHRTILQKRQDKFYDQSIDIQNQFFIDNNNSIEKFKGLLCQINSTWAFRLIDSKYYPNFGRNIGIMNNSRAIIVLQTKVRHIIDHTSVTGKQ
ncbi:unnamed protein product [Rotaria sp. Silwood1]|nr:unnamed protein product [Rotaria sp. Silwood1]